MNMDTLTVRVGGGLSSLATPIFFYFCQLQCADFFLCVGENIFDLSL